MRDVSEACEVEIKLVVSSNIKGVGYDEDKSTLYVEYQSGMYRYFHVPREVYDLLIVAPSPGRFVASHVKPVYDCERI